MVSTVSVSAAILVPLLTVAGFVVPAPITTGTTRALSLASWKKEKGDPLINLPMNVVWRDSYELSQPQTILLLETLEVNAGRCGKNE